jgi:pimeloyl-ACP methyl ester carboxylesterase
VKEKATSDREVAVFLPTPHGDIFAIATRPTKTPNGLGILILQGGRGLPSFGRNRLWTDLARTWAADGFYVGRFDYRGVGDSAGSPEMVRLDAPYTIDATSVVDWMSKEWGIREWILMGSCFGARTALATGIHLPGLAGLAFFPIPVRDFARGDQFVSYPLSWYLRRALRPSSIAGLFARPTRTRYLRAAKAKVRHTLRRGTDNKRIGEGRGALSPILFTELSAVLERRVPVVFIYGDEDLFYEDFQRARSGRLGRLLERTAPLVTVRAVEGKVHGLTSVDIQQRIADELNDWLRQRFDTGSQVTAESI